MREHLESVQRQSGKTPEELIDVPCPPSFEPVWRIFHDLDSGRSMHAAGPNPLAWESIAAWSQLTGNRLDDLELLALRTIDTAYLMAHAASSH